LNLTGTVKLEGQTDHTGVTVALSAMADPQGGYAPVALDTMVQRMNRDFPMV
jgi:hypothetical protein